MKKFIIICIVILCACVFPISLVRKSVGVGTVMSDNFGTTDYMVQELKQVFTAQTNYLQKIAFDVEIADDNAKGRYCVFVKDEDKQKIIVEKYISFEDAGNAAYTYVPVEKWIRKGGEYSVSVTAEGIEGFYVYYSLVPEEAAPGSQRLYLNGEVSANPAVMEYTYRFPLNVKNVLCLWAFILTVGLSILEMLKKKETGENLPVIRKLHEWLDRFQILFLLIESAVILFLIIMISGTDAVDWDEAYTWWMTTKNTIPEMLKATAADVHPPLYYLFVKAAMAVFGKNIVVARMVSVAGAAATCLLVSTLVRKRFGVKAASLLLLVVGLGTQMIYYNVNVRMYSWMIFFVMAAGLSAYEIMIDSKVKSWILFTLFSLGGVYTQYFSVVPLAVMYVFLLIWFMVQDRKQIKKWFVCAVATVVGYLPWLAVVIKVLKNDYVGAAEKNIAFSLKDWCSWMFGSNIKFSEYMPVILFVIGVLWLLFTWKKQERKERAFIALTGMLFFVSYIICVLLASRMGHFWHYRYLVDVLLFVWLFLIIFISKKGMIVWGVSMIWLGISVLSSYTVVRTQELETVPWTDEAKQLLKQVPELSEQMPEKKQVVYDYITFDMLYQYWLPNAEFIWYEDVDIKEMDAEFYVITWRGGFYHSQLFSDEMLKKERIGSMRLEIGVADVELWKITVNERPLIK